MAAEHTHQQQNQQQQYSTRKEELTDAAEVSRLLKQLVRKSGTGALRLSHLFTANG